MDYLILSAVLMAIGITGLLTKRQLLKVCISVELIAIAATMNFVMLASSAGMEVGEAFLVLAFSTDTSVSAIILALLIAVSKKYGTTDIGELMKGDRESQTLEDDA